MGAISRQIHPVYTVKERQPISTTIDKGRGSCSQRLACLEGLARSRGIGTRVRALWVSGRFWNNRFPLARLFVPSRVLLAWPQFAIDGDWCGVEEISGSLEPRAAAAIPFANYGETLFEAVRSAAVDFEGKTRTCATVCDLSNSSWSGVESSTRETICSISSARLMIRGKARPSSCFTEVGAALDARLAGDRSARLVVHADDQQLVRLALIVDPEWRDSPTSHESTGS
jgi:hypothetical protein